MDIVAQQYNGYVNTAANSDSAVWAAIVVFGSMTNWFNNSSHLQTFVYALQANLYMS
jgi:hypothetical protein